MIFIQNHFAISLILAPGVLKFQENYAMLAFVKVNHVHLMFVRLVPLLLIQMNVLNHHIIVLGVILANFVIIITVLFSVNIFPKNLNVPLTVNGANPDNFAVVKIIQFNVLAVIIILKIHVLLDVIVLLILKNLLH